MAWRDELTEAELAKLAVDLRDWLDGADAGGLGLLAPDADTTKVWANVGRELPSERVDDFAALGLDAEEGMVAVPGVVSRDRLLVLARHPDVVGLAPVRGSKPAAPRPTEPPQGGATHG